MKLIFAISALAALSLAQDINSLNDCGKKCVSDMTTGKAGDLKCAANDAKCLCANPDFTNGLKDCSSQACGGDQSGKVAAYGSAYCSSAGGSGGSSSGSGGSASTATSSASSSASSVSASASSALSSAASSASSALSSASSSIASVAASASSKASSAAGSATSSSASAFAMKTQAPLAAAGILGIAALLV